MLNRKIHNYWLVPLFVFSLAACFGGEDKQPELTSLDKQSLQTRDYETSKSVAFASVISVFQDLGYIINSANKDSGFINARSPQVVTSSRAEKIFIGTTVQENTKVTAFIEEVGKFTRIRLTFLQTTKVEQGGDIWGDDSLSGTTATDKPIYDRQIYQNAFNLVEEAIFLRTPSPGQSQSAPSS